MNLILNNPFRILGLPITASERESAKRVSDLTIFAEMGKVMSFPTDFPFLSDIERTPEAIRNASNQIGRPEGRLFHSLFWFWDNSHADPSGLDLLRHGDVEGTIISWSKHADHGNVTPDKYSTLRNLSILYLGLAGSDHISHSVRQQLLSKGIDLAGQVFSHPLFDDYSRNIAGRNTPSDRQTLSIAFADEIIGFARKYIDMTEGIAPKELLECFKSFPSEIFPYLSKTFVSQPIQRIETEIENARKGRMEHPRDAALRGERLFRNTQTDLAHIGRILSHTDFQYQIIADKLANETLQCAIDYFNTLVKQSHAHDPGKKALDLANRTASIAVGKRIGARIEENLFIMKTWIRSAPQRKYQQEIQLLIDDIVEQLDTLPGTPSSQNAPQTPSQDALKMARHLLDHSIDKLLLIKASLGADDLNYLNLSSAVADRASALCMADPDPDNAYNLMERISTLDMLPEIRNRYDRNNEIFIRKRETQALNALRESSTSSDKETLCYVATMVYGDCDAPEVLLLRAFRDNVLRCHALGKLFIRFYYRYSPVFVETFKHSKKVNAVLRIILNQFIHTYSISRD